MKLKNKKTGEIAEASILNSELVVHYDDGRVERYSLLPEHYEEPKEWWYIDIHGPHKMTNNDEYYQQVKAASKEIGNCFETREEAELAVRKLKAWKRLKDKGFRFIKDWVYKYDMPKVENHTYIEFVAICEDGALFNDLDLLFSEVENE